MVHLLGIFLFTSGVATAYAFKSIAQKKNVTNSDNTEDVTNLKSSEKSLAPSATELALDENWNFHFNLATASALATVVGTLFYPPLSLISLPLIGYSTRILFDDVYHSIKRREPHISTLDSFAVIMGIATGQYLLSAIANFLYIISLKMLDRTRDKAQKNFADIFSDNPTTAWLLKDDIEVNVPLEQVKKDDLIVVNTSETIPIDGTIVDGVAQIDQHMLTGEAQPEEKVAGQDVFTTTLVMSGRIVVKVKETGADTVAAHITKVLEKTDDYISVLETRTERFANNSVLPTVGLSSLAFLISGPRAMAVVLSSNFSEVTRFIMPLTMLNYLQTASQHGILIKDGRSLEQLSKVDTVVFDKTGTLTLEQPHVGAIYPADGFNVQQVLYYTAAAEYRQPHPIAKAILNAAIEQEIELPTIDDAEYTVGYGISVNLDGKVVRVGSARFMKKAGIHLPSSVQQIEQEAYELGYSLVYTSLDNDLCGVIELHPTVRPEAAQVVVDLQKRGLKVYILSGDHEGPVKNLAQELGVDDYIAETLPEDKSRVIDELQADGKKVCFIGDGINDSIALKKAAVSVSLQDASRVAMDSAQVILMSKNLTPIVEAFELSDNFELNQKVGINAGVIAPSVICMGGAIFLSFTITNTLVFYCSSMAISVGSAVYPLVANKLTDRKPKIEYEN